MSSADVSLNVVGLTPALLALLGRRVLPRRVRVGLDTGDDHETAEQDARDISNVVNAGVKPHADAICKGLQTLGIATGISGC